MAVMAATAPLQGELRMPKHLQRIEIRHQKSISPALMSEQTNNFGAHAPPPTFQSLVKQMIQRHCHSSPWVLRKKKKTKEVNISSVFTIGLHEWDWETGQVNNAAWGFPFHSNRKNYNMRVQLFILTHSRSSCAWMRSQQCLCSGTTCKKSAVLGKRLVTAPWGHKQPPWSA